MHRFLSLLFFLPFFSMPVLSSPAWAVDPVDPGPTPAHHARLSWEQHFTQANLAHDGHLTLEEAKGGYALVAKHFEDIDADHKGYVTENDVRAWQVLRRTAHRLTKPPEAQLRPRPAFQSGCPDLRTVSASGSQTVTPTAAPATTSAPAPAIATAPAPATDGPAITAVPALATDAPASGN
jgi:hypothetical protein